MQEEEGACVAALDELRRGMDEVSGRIADLSRAIADCTTESTEARVAAGTASSSVEELRLRRESAEASSREKQERHAGLAAEREDYARMLTETR